MNAQHIQERYAGHPFVDYFDCLTAALAAARKRNRQAIQARRDGDPTRAAQHVHMRRYYMQRVRAWHNMIDWSAE